MNLTEEEKQQHSALYDQLMSERNDRHENLKRELLDMRRSASQARAWRLIFWTVVAVAILFGSKLVSSPRLDLAALASVAILGYAAVADKIAVLGSEAEEANMRLQHFAKINEDILYRVTTLDEVVNRLERYVRTRARA